jgi:hypothetical protein
MRLFFPRVLFAGLIMVGINSLLKGVSENETWRIVLAVSSIVGSCVLFGATFIKRPFVEEESHDEIG